MKISTTSAVSDLMYSSSCEGAAVFYHVKHFGRNSCNSCSTISRGGEEAVCSSSEALGFFYLLRFGPIEIRQEKSCMHVTPSRRGSTPNSIIRADFFSAIFLLSSVHSCYTSRKSPMTSPFKSSTGSASSSKGTPNWRGRGSDPSALGFNQRLWGYLFRNVNR